jgi:hypothetical protein
MPLSGSYDFSVTRDTIIQAALRKLGVLGDGQTPTTAQYNNAAFSLNLMTKAWQAEGMPLWARKFLYLLPVTGTNEYLVGPTAQATYHCVTSYRRNDIATTINSPTTSLVLSTSDTSTSGDYVGIELDNGNIFWTTTTTTGAGTTKTITTTVPSQASAGLRVFFHAAGAFAQKFLRLQYAWRIDLNSDLEIQIPMNMPSMQDMQDHMNGSVANIPIEISYIPSQGSPLPGGTSTVYLWPRFKGGDYIIKMDVQYPYQDFDASTNDPDFPQEFYEALVYNLAVRLAPDYKYPAEARTLLKQEAVGAKKIAFDSNYEEASFFIQPTNERWR